MICDWTALYRFPEYYADNSLNVVPQPPWGPRPTRYRYKDTVGDVPLGEHFGFCDEGSDGLDTSL